MWNHVSCAYDFGVTRLTEITATIKKLKLRGLLSNINPKIHFFNYSADINPFLHCATGNIDGNFKWEKKKHARSYLKKWLFPEMMSQLVSTITKSFILFYFLCNSRTNQCQIVQICVIQIQRVHLLDEKDIYFFIYPDRRKRTGRPRQSWRRSLGPAQVNSNTEVLWRKPSGWNQYHTGLIFSFESDLLSTNSFLPARPARC